MGWKCTAVEQTKETLHRFWGKELKLQASKKEGKEGVTVLLKGKRGRGKGHGGLRTRRKTFKGESRVYLDAPL